MVVLYEEIQKIAAVDATVLIEGETGTGRNWWPARFIASRRARRPSWPSIVPALPTRFWGVSSLDIRREPLPAPSITRRVLRRRRGDPLLDEIGDISCRPNKSSARPPEQEVTRLGNQKPRKVDVRLVVATHHNLAEDVEKGTFRRDLLYRIKVARLRLAPLRERPSDVPLLVHAFLGQFRSVMEKSVLQVSPEALQVLTAYPWPGNVRELKSAVESALIHCKGTVVQVGIFHRRSGIRSQRRPYVPPPARR